MNILIVVNNLSGGGAEKVAVDLANNFSDRHDVTVLTLSNKEDKYRLNPAIKRVSVKLNKSAKNIFQGIFFNITRVFRLRLNILKNEPDLVVTFMDRTNIRVLMSLLFKSVPVIITEHNYPKLNKMSFSWEILRKIFYKKAYKLVSVSRGISDCFDYLPENKKTIIYNPTELHFNKNSDNLLNLNKKNIVAMGRLVEIKRFDLLIDAFSIISLDFPEWNLNILGDGELFESLNSQIQKLKLENRIFLHGFSSFPHETLKKADLFVLSSRTEGLGNVIIEAMKCGVPVLSVDCPVGPRELIEDGKTGLLVKSENVNELARGMNRIIENPELRKELVMNADKALIKFSNKYIFECWDEILEEVIVTH